MGYSGIRHSVITCFFFFQEWHKFLMQFEGKVVEWNMGTLLRLNCKAGISDENTILGQFIACCFIGQFMACCFIGQCMAGCFIGYFIAFCCVRQFMKGCFIGQFMAGCFIHQFTAGCVIVLSTSKHLFH